MFHRIPHLRHRAVGLVVGFLVVALVAAAAVAGSLAQVLHMLQCHYEANS